MTENTIVPWTNSIGKCFLCSIYFHSVTSFKNYFWFTLCYSAYFYSTSAYDPSTIYLHGALQSPTILKCLCFLNRIRLKKKIYVFQSFYTKQSTHTGSPNASKQAIYPLERETSSERQCPPSQRSSDASHRLICSSAHTVKRAHQLCTLSSHFPAQNCLGPLTAYQTVKHSFSRALPSSPKHSPHLCLHFYPSAANLSTQLALPRP